MATRLMDVCFFLKTQELYRRGSDGWGSPVRGGKREEVQYTRRKNRERSLRWFLKFTENCHIIKR